MYAHHTSSGMQKPAEGVRSPGAAVTNSCGAKNRIWPLSSKSSKCSYRAISSASE